jgi:ubiquinone/menaquinone biosynthesis C-methylase UbiE
MIATARRAIPAELKGRIDFRDGSAGALPCADGEFTHVLCTNSFHHYPDPQAALIEMQRVLVSGGRMVILENAPDLSWYVWMWDKTLRLFESGHVRYYPSHELGALIRTSGFRNVELVVLRNEFLKHGKLFASIQVWTGVKEG